MEQINRAVNKHAVKRYLEASRNGNLNRMNYWLNVMCHTAPSVADY